MSNTKHIILDEAITYQGAILPVGEVVELPAKSAQALIDEGKGRQAENYEGSKPASSGNKNNSTSSQTGTDEEAERIEKLRKALDEKYKNAIPALKEHAKAENVQFTSEATKAEIIAAVIEAGKAEEILAK
ncbi:hypothetical protein [Metabacillus fastidiosus]|uniref:hypothetical protein n=1 Tax=Metabacillus fastidiosus TaxID=1458 RepID=UPI003D291480